MTTINDCSLDSTVQHLFEASTAQAHNVSYLIVEMTRLTRAIQQLAQSNEDLVELLHQQQDEADSEADSSPSSLDG